MFAGKYATVASALYGKLSAMTPNEHFPGKLGQNTKCGTKKHPISRSRNGQKIVFYLTIL